MSETVSFRDFSKKRPRVYFGIDGEEFDARKALGPKRLQRAVTAFRGSQKAEGDEVDVDAAMDKLIMALQLILKEESYVRFIALMDDEERDEPIDVPQLTEIFQWLMEQYSQRPTEALSDSLNSSSTDNAGTGSLDGALQLELIP